MKAYWQRRLHVIPMTRRLATLTLALAVFVVSAYVAAIVGAVLTGSGL